MTDSKKGQIQFINIQGFMIYDLLLKGTELLLYALIYGYTQDGKNEYHGSLNYIANGLQISRTTTIDVLKKLQKKGLVIKTKESHFIASKETVLVQKLHQTSTETAPLASKETVPQASIETVPNNNNEIDIINNNKNNKGIIKNLEFFVKTEIIENKEFINRQLLKHNLTMEDFKDLLIRYVNYWGQKNPGEEIESWQREKKKKGTFDFKRRFITFILNNKKGYSNNNNSDLLTKGF